MSVNPSEIIWTIINFLALLLITSRLLLKPILKVVDQREAKLAAGAAARQKCAAAARESEKAIAQEQERIKAQATGLLSSARSEAREARSQEQHSLEKTMRERRLLAESRERDQAEELAGALQAHAPGFAGTLLDRILGEAALNEGGGKGFASPARAAERCEE